MFDARSEVIRALVRYADVFDPNTCSVILVGRAAKSFGRDPFRGGFIARIEERAELVRRLRRLHPRKRTVLCLWYMTSRTAVEIAKHVGVSRMHCYRLRNQALAEMARAEEEEGAPRPQPQPVLRGAPQRAPVSGAAP